MAIPRGERFDTGDLTVLILMAPFYADFLTRVLPLRIGVIAVSIAFMIATVRIVATRRFDVGYGFIDLCLLLLAATAFLSTTSPIGEPGAKLTRAIAFCYTRLLMAVLVISSIRRPEQLRRAAYGFIGVGVVSAAVALWQFWTFELTGINYSFAEGENLFRATSTGLVLRASGLGKNPNEIGPTMAAAAILGLYLGMCSLGTRRVVYFFAVGILVGGVVVTFSRAAVLSLLIACLVLPFAPRPNATGRLGRRAALAGGAGIVLIAIGAVAGVFELLGDLGEAISIRVDLNQLAVRAIMDYPITGVGIDAFDYYNNAYGEPVHNLFLQVAAELGMLGLAAFTALVASLGAGLIRAVWRAKDHEAGAILGGVALGYLGQLVTHLGNPVLPDLAFWFYVGLAAAAVRVHSSVAETLKDDRGYRAHRSGGGAV